MNSEITTLEPPVQTVMSRNILSKDGFSCSVITLAPHDEIPRSESSQVEEHILFIIEGEALVRFEDVNMILNQEEASLIPKGRKYSLAAHGSGGAKLLRVDVPPRQIVTPPILSFDS
jgi:mannose-6-phosphate isomerase-like protein (cupin superfamily)